MPSSDSNTVPTKVTAYATVVHDGTDPIGLKVTDLFWSEEAAYDNWSKYLDRNSGYIDGGVRKVDVTAALLRMPMAVRRLISLPTSEPEPPPATTVTPTSGVSSNTEPAAIAVINTLNDVRKMFGQAPFVTDLDNRLATLLQAATQLRRERDAAKARLADLRRQVRAVLDPIVKGDVT